MPSRVSISVSMIALIGIASACILAADVYLRGGFDAPALYLFLLLGLQLWRNPRAYLPFAGLASALIVIGAVLGPHDAPLYPLLINRALTVTLIVLWSLILARNIKQTDKLMNLSMTDPLTGVLNRRQYMIASAAELTRTRRYGFPLSVLMIDIDNFKRINDTYGHAVGDLTIRTLASTTRAALRLPDILARYGGEEFVVTMPQTAEPEALRVAERLRQNLGSVEIVTKDGPLTITVSIGLAQWMPGESTIEDVLDRADKALYVAKHNGKNQVRVAPRALAA